MIGKHKLLALLLLPFLFRCGGDAEFVAVSMPIKHELGGNALVSGQAQALSDTMKISVSHLEYYISDVWLEKEGGNRFTIDGVWYVNAVEGYTISPTGKRGGLSLDLGMVLANTLYETMHFTIGLAEMRNKSNALPSTTENLNMAWPETMGGGYHYMKLEGQFTNATGIPQGFATHTGPGMDRAYSVDVSLPLPQGKQTASSMGELVYEIFEWYRNPQYYSLTQYPGMMMGNAKAQEILQANGKTVFSIR